MAELRALRRRAYGRRKSWWYGVTDYRSNDEVRGEIERLEKVLATESARL